MTIPHIRCSLLGIVLLLAACSVDTTGIATESTRTPHPLSNPDAPVVVTEFIDLECEACRSAQVLVDRMLASYGSQIRYEVKHFPIYPSHAYSKEAAEAAECAADQGKFWDFERKAYENQAELSPGALSEWADALGLDMDLFERCRKSDLKLAIVEASSREGDALGVNGTPTFFVDGRKVEGTLEAIGAAIRQAQSGAMMPL